jgi:hypothetical protein
VKQSSRVEAAVEQLGLMGYYRFDEPGAAEAAKAAAISNGWFFYESTIRGPYHADAEDLTEGDVISLLQRVKPFLDTQGVQLEDIEQDFNIGGGYSVKVNGKEYVLYTEDELNEVEDVWGLTTRRCLGMLNDLLQRSQSVERVYLLYGGNDAQVVFLTPAMQELISRTPGVPVSEKPVDATAP